MYDAITCCAKLGNVYQYTCKSRYSHQHECITLHPFLYAAEKQRGHSYTTSIISKDVVCQRCCISKMLYVKDVVCQQNES